jgi:hypothetical protein
VGLSYSDLGGELQKRRACAHPGYRPGHFALEALR